MKKTKNPSMAFTSFCLKIGVLLAALLISLVCALFNPSAGQAYPLPDADSTRPVLDTYRFRRVPVTQPQVHAMVKNQPFPFGTGVAMDTILYASVRAKLNAAERLRVSSEATIKQLQKEIADTKTALAKQTNLGDYDAGKAAGLSARLNLLEADLFAAQTRLNQAKSATEQVLSALPRSIRKTLVQASPDQIATVVVDYIRTLRLRKWIWGGIAGGVGFVFGLVLPFLL